MQNHKIEFDEVDAILAIKCLRVSDIEVGSKLDSMWCLLNGKWEYALNQMSYFGYSSNEQMCEIVTGDRKWKMHG